MIETLASLAFSQCRKSSVTPFSSDMKCLSFFLSFCQAYSPICVHCPHCQREAVFSALLSDFCTIVKIFFFCCLTFLSLILNNDDDCAFSCSEFENQIRDRKKLGKKEQKRATPQREYTLQSTVKNQLGF